MNLELVELSNKLSIEYSNIPTHFQEYEIKENSKQPI